MSGNDLHRRWEELAREDAEFYIWTDPIAGDEFFRSGERDAARILAFAQPHVARFDAALEIGCGVGRLTIPMSRHFGQVTGVDVAPTMLKKLEDNCKARDIDNVSGLLADQPWDRSFHDFAYTRIVLQHVDPWSDIVRYIERLAQALGPGGILYAQFDTRAPNVLYHLRNRLPDSVLPRTYRRGVRRIRRQPAQVIAAARAVGFELIAQRGNGTADHEFLFRRA